MANVFVGMSGGVDSSVSVALLKEAGHDVTGIFIKVWQPEGYPCTWEEDREDAMRVAAQLNIPFETLDLSETYKKEVVDYMIDSYKKGDTPNPDVMCNKHVKFGGFFEWAMRKGADYVATGHYAQVRNVGGTPQLVKGLDQNKDQSYFLWTITQEQLSKTLFPVGEFEKTHTRQLAIQFALPVAEKKDSQGLCFIGKLDMKEFLSEYIVPQVGVVLNEEGNEIGTHDGAWFYTLGQRHGFSIASSSSSQRPHFVVSKDVEKNVLVVSTEDSKDDNYTCSSVELDRVNWIASSPTLEKTYTCRFRYRQELTECSISGDNSVDFSTPQSYVPSGQSLVIYDDDVCLGGGIIR